MVSTIFCGNYFELKRVVGMLRLCYVFVFASKQNAKWLMGWLVFRASEFVRGCPRLVSVCSLLALDLSNMFLAFVTFYAYSTVQYNNGQVV